MPKKQDRDSTMAMKLFGLYGLLLFSGRKYTLTQLATQFSCSKQTILRLLAQMDMAHGVPIKLRSAKNGRENEYWAEVPRRPLNVTLTASALSNLLLCRDLVCHLLPKAMREEAGMTVRHATTLLAEFDRRALVTDELGASLAKGRIDYDRHQDKMKVLLKAMRMHRVCEITYRAARSGAPKTYCIGPMRLTAYHEALYVKALVIPGPGQKAYDDPLMLAVHRIESVTLTDRKFAFPENGDAQETTGFGFASNAAFTARVHFGANVSDYVSERTWSPDQVLVRQSDGSVELKFTANNRFELVAWVLSFGDSAELLEPEDVRAEVGEIAGRVAARYEKGRQE